MTQITIEQIHKDRQNFISTNHPSPAYELGRSIVTTCYNKEFTGGWVLLNELFRLNVSIPVEVFYREGELYQNQIDLLKSISPLIEVKKIQGVAKNFKDRYGNTQGWGSKVYALYESKYAENLWIDCDNYPIRNPEFLFDDPEYIQKGSLFWRDVFSVDSADQYSTNSIMWQVFGIQPSDAEPFESGQFLINKVKCWKQFNLVKYYADNCEWAYQFGGDKETWKFAWQLLSNYHSYRNYQASPSVPFGFMPFGPFMKGLKNQFGKWGGGTIMVQRDRDGNELFNHRTMAKFKAFQKNEFNHDIKNEQFYHDHIKRLEEIDCQ